MSTLTAKGHNGTVEFDGGRQMTDAVSDENSVVFTKKQSGDFQAIRDAIEAAIVAAHAPAAPAPTSQAWTSLCSSRSSRSCVMPGC